MTEYNDGIFEAYEEMLREDTNDQKIEFLRGKLKKLQKDWENKKDDPEWQEHIKKQMDKVRKNIQQLNSESIEEAVSPKVKKMKEQYGKVKSKLADARSSLRFARTAKQKEAAKAKIAALLPKVETLGPQLWKESGGKYGLNPDKGKKEEPKGEEPKKEKKSISSETKEKLEKMKEKIKEKKKEVDAWKKQSGEDPDNEDDFHEWKYKEKEMKTLIDKYKEELKKAKNEGVNIKEYEKLLEEIEIPLLLNDADDATKERAKKAKEGIINKIKELQKKKVPISKFFKYIKDKADRGSGPDDNEQKKMEQAQEKLNDINSAISVLKKKLNSIKKVNTEEKCKEISMDTEILIEKYIR